MPRGDRTGPMGMGPRTGRGLGYCQGYDAPGAIDPACGFGRGWRRGWGGFGWHHRFTPPTQEEILQGSKSEADWLKGQLETINKRIAELEK